MARKKVPAVFYRGGTSKGMFFHERDLPADKAARDRIILHALGSPDPYKRQLNGMGGGLSSLSKVVIVAPSSRPDADVDYTFGQVAVDEALVDYVGSCGNLSSSVGAFAVDEGLVKVPDGAVCLRVHMTNSMHCSFAGASFSHSALHVGEWLNAAGLITAMEKVALRGYQHAGAVLPVSQVEEGRNPVCGRGDIGERQNVTQRAKPETAHAFDRLFDEVGYIATKGNVELSSRASDCRRHCLQSRQLVNAPPHTRPGPGWIANPQPPLDIRAGKFEKQHLKPRKWGP